MKLLYFLDVDQVNLLNEILELVNLFNNLFV